MSKNPKKLVLLPAFILILISLAISVSAVECNNCSDCNDKIAAASPGDTIYLNTSIIDHPSTACINIARSGITFDCQDNTIDAAASNNNPGIEIDASSSAIENVSLKNCVVDDFLNGIFFDGESTKKIKYCSVEDINISATYDGIKMEYSESNTFDNLSIDIGASWIGGISMISSSNYNNFTDIDVSNCGYGIDLNGVSYNRFESINASYNGRTGVYLRNNAHDNEFYDVTALYNSDSGIDLSSANNNEFYNITASHNTDYGIDMQVAGSGNQFQDITVKENKIQDIYYGETSSYPANTNYCNNAFQNITGSGDREIIVTNDSENIENKILSQLILCNADNSNINNVTIISSSSEDNNGMYAFWVDNSNFTDINSSNNRYGFHAVKSQDNILNDLIFDNNKLDGLYTYYTDYSNFTNIQTWDNEVNGIYVLLSDYNNFKHINSQDSGYRDAGFHLSNSLNNYLYNLTLVNTHNEEGDGLYISSCNNANTTIENVNASGNGHRGIFISSSSHVNIISAIIHDNDYSTSFNEGALKLYRSNNNTLSNLSIKNNADYGIFLHLNSQDNNITNSYIENNGDEGIFFREQDPFAPGFNYIYNNYFKNDKNFGIYDTLTNPNYWNVTSYTATNIAGGPDIGGNFWGTPNEDGFSDNCADNDMDGFCDSSYELNASGPQIDYLPLKPLPVMPDVTTFTSSELTTNFSEVANLRNVTNMTIAKVETGKIQFPEDYGVDSDGENYDEYVEIGDLFISINTSALDSTFNTSVTITLENVNCPAEKIFYAENFHSSREDIILAGQDCEAAGICTDVQCVGTTLTFNVSHFTGFATSGNANLTIEPGDAVRYIFNPVEFYAWYVDSADGTPISGECNISFDDAWGTWFEMDYNGSEYNYTKSLGFETAGTHYYNVTCSNDTYADLEAEDSKFIGAAIPEFSTVTLGLGLIAVLGGLFIFRRKN